MNTSITYDNPVIRGFFPDPSICRAEGKYYLVCSSFQYFPGIPLFESSDLINWKQIGHILTRESQLPLHGADSSGGIYAPTIRFHNGWFYVTATNVNYMGNFFVRTDNIYGEWSDPIPVDQDGIDPSLYFEDDAVYFMSNHANKDGSACIMQCRIDPLTGARLEASRPVWNGCGGRYLEAPHLYRINNRYYLMAAEGGTEYGHMVVIARGDNPYGPFENSPDNPIVSNRDLGGYPLQGTGHGDLIQDEFGNWWMVLLAFRQIGQYLPFHHLGREVCLIPVYFTANGWVNAGAKGKVYLHNTFSRPCRAKQKFTPDVFTFRNIRPGKELVWLRNPDLSNYDLSLYDSNTPIIKMRGTSSDLSEAEHSPTFLGIRQREMRGHSQVRVELPCSGEAGFTLYMNHDAHYDFAIIKERKTAAIILRRVAGDLTDIRREPLPPDIQSVILHIEMDAQTYSFQAEADGKEYCLGSAMTRYLSSEVACGFTGVMIGLYAAGTGNGQAGFSEFAYRPHRETTS